MGARCGKENGIFIGSIWECSLKDVESQNPKGRGGLWCGGLGGGNSCSKGREVECPVSSKVSGLGWASTLESEKWGRVNADEAGREAFWIRLWVFRFYYVCNGQTHRKLLNSGDALGFWQKALAAMTGWVEVGRSCRWRAPWKAA